MINRLKIPLEQDEYSALLEAAHEDLRNPIDYIRSLVRADLERRGLLVRETIKTDKKSESAIPTETLKEIQVVRDMLSTLDQYPEMMLVPEVAAVLRVSKATAYTMASKRVIPSIQFMGSVRIPREELRRFITRQLS